MTKKWLYNNSFPDIFFESLLDNLKKALDFLNLNLDFTIYFCFTYTA